MMPAIRTSGEARGASFVKRYAHPEKNKNKNKNVVYRGFGTDYLLSQASTGGLGTYSPRKRGD